MQASRTLIPHRTKDFPLPVMNLMNTEVHMDKGITMAELQPVEVLGQFSCPDVSRAQGECIELMNGIDVGVPDAKRAQLRKLLQEFGGFCQSVSMIWDRRGSRNIVRPLTSKRS